MDIKDRSDHGSKNGIRAIVPINEEMDGMTILL